MSGPDDLNGRPPEDTSPEDTGLDDAAVPATASSDVADNADSADLEATPVADTDGPTADELAITGRPSPTRGLIVACAVLAATALVMTVLAATFYNRYHSQANDREAVERASGQFASALLTYDYRDLDKAKRQVLALATGNFRKDYEANFGALKTLLESTKSQSSSTVKEIFVAPIQHDATSSFIVLSLTVSGTAGTHRTLEEYVRLDLVKVQSGWRVDGVTNLNLGQEPSAGPVATTTSTTAPK